MGGTGTVIGLMLGTFIGLKMTTTLWGEIHFALPITLLDMVFVTLVMVFIGWRVGSVAYDSHELGYFLGWGALYANLGSLLVLYLRYKRIIPKTAHNAPLSIVYSEPYTHEA